MYYFSPLYKNRKSFQMSTIRSNRKCSKVIGISSDIFGNVRKSSDIVGNLWKWFGCFLEIQVMMRQKSHAFNPEKVGRYYLRRRTRMEESGRN